MQRTRTAVLLASALLVLAGVGTALAEEEHMAHGEPHGQMAVRGEVLDMACYMAHEAKGPEHAACAERCAKGGQPMGLLAEDGTVYLLYANHKDGSAFESTKEYAGQNVVITGIMATRAGIKGFEVNSVKPL
jgi:hypothetical protein